MSQLQYKFNKNDEYYTPSYAVYPIISRLKEGSTIWCPFDKEESEFVKVFKKEGFNVIHGHIEDGQDFFEVEVPKCDYIISNPPYSLKNDVFKRLYAIGKPFAMLINFQGIFDHKDRFEMFRSNTLELLYLSPRVNYIKPESDKATGVPFQSGYLCSNICKNSLEFESLDKTK
ncbi:MAG: hypothetical protein ACRDAG_01155 [Cetobacterium somerae]|uniref:hypothetical protein n=1 Tax=Cetobacterium somerae TaxID=188913 RepID=UPI003F35F06A